MAGGSQGANPSQIAPQGIPQGNAGISPQQAAIGQAALQGYNPQVQMQQLQRPPAPPAIPQQGLPSIQGQTKPMVMDKAPELDEGRMQSIYESQHNSRGYADGGQIGLSSYANPNQNFMQYPQQGQPNQPPVLSNALPTTQFMGGPDSGADYASANLGFDGSGSDGGVGGQPAPMATPLAQGNKPLGLAQFQQPQGLQIAGNPTSQVVQRPQQR